VFFLLRWIVSESSLGLLLLIRADPHGILFPPPVTLPKRESRPVLASSQYFFWNVAIAFGYREDGTYMPTGYWQSLPIVVMREVSGKECRHANP
jgi:hypothetical protein